MKGTITGLVAGLLLHLPAWSAEGLPPHVDTQGGISLPKDFRTHYVHLGSWAVIDEKSAARGLHDVYADPAAVAHYREHGRFPDGATLVKEIRAFGRGALTTGDRVLWGTTPAVWFVMIKDAHLRFQDHPGWADGWGWALFKADNPGRNVATSYSADCKSCHVPAAATDRVFVQGYPTLRP